MIKADGDEGEYGYLIYYEFMPLPSRPIMRPKSAAALLISVQPRSHIVRLQGCPLLSTVYNSLPRKLLQARARSDPKTFSVLPGVLARRRRI